jgi:hypothetical protein
MLQPAAAPLPLAATISATLICAAPSSAWSPLSLQWRTSMRSGRLTSPLLVSTSTGTACDS